MIRPLSSDRSLTFLAVLLACSFSVHNFEEWFQGLPDWLSVHVVGAFVPEPSQLALALGVLTVGAWVGVVWVWLTRTRRANEWGVAFVASMLLGNSISHLVLSTVTRSFMPGLLTALLVLAPIATLVLVNLRRSLDLGWPSLPLLLVAGFAAQALVPLVAFSALRLFYAV